MLKFLLEKEFKQILRNSFLPRMIFMMPVMMILVMPWAANQEVKNIKLSVVDNDHSSYSERLINKVIASGYFILEDVSASNNEAMKSIESGSADIILDIRPEFEKDLIKTGTANVMISANAVNGTKGGLGSGYLSAIMNDFASEISAELGLTVDKGITPVINIEPHNKYNVFMDYKVFMLPALAVMLLTMIAGFLPALNIVGEKEAGTIEQMNVTPVNRLVFILAKLIPYWIIGFIVLSICFILSALVYGLCPVGNLLTIYLYASVYILTVSGLGLVISNYSDSMQQAMFVMFFFMLILILLSGLYTPISSMPEWAQMITKFNPLSYFIQVMRSVYLKGSGLMDLLPKLYALCGFAVVFNVWAIVSYKKSN
ncbi:ABC transporter permease [Dysgonomonas capnocytophagoides]|uniref:ABC transporter permease n=1 Tax=Dysgonomonas capnocytophagoides TaxID=45254 RepID=A0A4Y8L479_9BACT|nr:ABC transporter permease [Dysgonomonas capnocytophagoides]TFD96878.1 ABC transporter permease [Dysgonomonas capnocytophagoides]